MEKSLSLSKPKNENSYFRENQTGFRCDECGGAFRKPILATVSSGGCVQKYYACPRCLTKVSEMEERKSEETIKKVTAELEESVECKHFLGYLKKRPKNTPVPEECLTCDKMIKCLLH